MFTLTHSEHIQRNSRKPFFVVVVIVMRSCLPSRVVKKQHVILSLFAEISGHAAACVENLSSWKYFGITLLVSLTEYVACLT